MDLRILVVTANPKVTTRLRLDEEVREIAGVFQRAKRRDEVQIKTLAATRHPDLYRAALEFQPSIVHFCGHADGPAGLAFEDPRGYAQLVGADALSEFFGMFADTVKCVVLNACYSEVQAEAIAKNIDFVVGMKQDVGDHEAIMFLAAFYDALGAGRDVPFAFKLAQNARKWIPPIEKASPVHSGVCLFNRADSRRDLS